MTNPKNVHGIITHQGDSRRSDYLFRVTVKAVILDKNNRVLVVKEHDRDWWDIPGGGMDHGESVEDAIRRELYEEISLTGDFEYQVILVEDPRYISIHNLYQMRIIFVVQPEDLSFEVGKDSDEVEFVDPLKFKDSKLITERKIYEYSLLGIELRG